MRLIGILTSFALLIFADVGLGAERRASQKIKDAVHPMRGMNADQAVKILTATLPGTDRNVIIIPNAESGRITMQAPAYRIRQFQRSLRQIDCTQMFRF